MNRNNNVMLKFAPAILISVLIILYGLVIDNNQYNFIELVVISLSWLGNVFWVEKENKKSQKKLMMMQVL
jgi:hypothetical protein